MGRHPEIELVSRDRGGDYAAARLGAPQAVQCADRFRLYKNLLEAVELTLACCRTEIRKTAQSAAQPVATTASKPLAEPTEWGALENWKPAPDLCAERVRLARCAQRQDRYEQVVALRAQGVGLVA